MRTPIVPAVQVVPWGAAKRSCRGSLHALVYGMGGSGGPCVRRERERERERERIAGALVRSKAGVLMYSIRCTVVYPSHSHPSQCHYNRSFTAVPTTHSTTDPYRLRRHFPTITLDRQSTILSARPPCFTICSSLSVREGSEGGFRNV